MPRAGLDPASVTEAGAVLADEIGFGRLSMGVLAGRLGVRTPSLYKHVGGRADLAHRIAVLGATELGDALREATQGRAQGDALAGAAQALRTYGKDHPGRYEAGNGARPAEPDDPFRAAVARVLASLAAVLRGYRLDPAQEIHALRMLRSLTHGFLALEAAGGYQLDADVDAGFSWLIRFVDQGLRAAAQPS